MNDTVHHVAAYIRKHTMLVTVVVTVVFLALALGEYFLYRKVMLLNGMVSEGFMQLKEQVQNQEMMEDVVMKRDGKMMMQRRNGEVVMMDKDIALLDGTKVSLDGALVLRDGTKMMMGEGQMMNMWGMMR
ncbi:hypothetical protein HYW87_00910 [Candidatus Roizmanbacteria bacterium]|nr:hypothetical protein [Candidatus Roizmanbacteria bacterium]